MSKLLHKSEQYDLTVSHNNDDICQLVLCPVAQNMKGMSVFIRISCVRMLLAVVEALVPYVHTQVGGKAKLNLALSITRRLAGLFYWLSAGCSHCLACLQLQPARVHAVLRTDSTCEK